MNIVLTFSNDQSAKSVHRVLKLNGIQAGGVFSTGADALFYAWQHSPVLLITASRLSDMDAFSLLEKMPADTNMILLTKNISYHGNNPSVIQMTLPINKADFVETVRMLISAGGGVSSPKGWVHAGDKRPVRTDDQHDKINRAKALLQKHYDMEESEAHRFLQKQSMDNGLKLSHTAELIINELS